jgi:hypothetical protein
MFVWVIDLLVNLPSPHLETPTRPSTPKVLQAKEHTPTPFPSIAFIFGFVVGSIKEFGGAHGCKGDCCKCCTTWINSQINLTWDLKVLNMYLFVNGHGITIQKWPNQLAQSLPNLVPLARWCCLVRNVDNLILLMLVTNGDTFVATSWHDTWKFVWLVDPFPHNGIFGLGCPTVELQLI